ncbi:MAG: acylase [Hellea sp.]|nr:acylase [Hellea sp.]
MNVKLWILAILTVLLIAAGIYLKTPAPGKYDGDAIRQTALSYDTRIIRDNWGVAHIFGKTDPDTSFGLGYSHAEDDWETIQATIMTSRGVSSQYFGTKKNLMDLESPIADYMFDLFKVREAVDAKIDTEVSREARAMAKAYADGLNLWAVENKSRVKPGILPMTDKDVIAGYTWATPFFFRMDEELKTIFADGDAPPLGPYNSSGNQWQLPAAVLGSNAFAVAPSRSNDGHTRLIVNSHQPMVGPYAWFEAHVVSEEGLNLAGGGFPGTPILAQGVTPTHGWAHTVNRPDLIDFYKLETDKEKNPKQYKLDGEWVDFEITKSNFRVKLLGPFSLPISKDMRWSEHGPVLETDSGYYALRFAGLQEVKALDQWYAMSKATSLDDWKTILKQNGVLSFNVIYADKDGNIGSLYNAKMPNRQEGPDWLGIVPGDTSALIWEGYRSVDELPQLYNPESGWLFSANSSPFFITEDGYNNSRSDYPESFGIEKRMTNRAMQARLLLSADPSISQEELLTYRRDGQYNEDSIILNLARDISAMEFEDERLREAQKIARDWDGSTEVESRGTAIMVLTAMHMGGYEYIEDLMPLDEAFAKAVDEIMEVYGRLDPPWGEVNRMRRGDVDMPLRGGPDTLRAIYGDYKGFVENKGLSAAAGDTHIMVADWDENGNLTLDTIHQFGAATLDENSPHYDDQAPLFARGEYKRMPMTLKEVLPLATRDYSPGH